MPSQQDNERIRDAQDLIDAGNKLMRHARHGASGISERERNYDRQHLSILLKKAAIAALENISISW